MTNTTLDFRRAFRRLSQNAAFTAFAVTSLGIGIGATSAIYALVDAIIFRPPAIANLTEVVNIYQSELKGLSPPASALRLSMADYSDLKKAQTSFSSITAWSTLRQPLIGNGYAEPTLAELVDGDYFETLGVHAALGRLIERTDDRISAAPVAVLSYSLWHRRFDADPEVIGKSIAFGQQSFTIVGVAAEAFTGVNIPSLVPTPLWIPLATATVDGVDYDPSDRERHKLMVKGRLRPGVSVALAAAEVKTIADRLEADFPSSFEKARVGDTGRAWRVMPARDLRVHESVHVVAQYVATAVMLVVAAVLLVTSTNLSNLLLARGAARRYQLAVELSLGATRARLLRSELAECALIAAGGLMAGLALARLLLLLVMNTTWQIGPGITTAVRPQLNINVLVVSLLATGAAFVIFGLLPAIHLTRISVRELLTADGSLTVAPRWHLRRSLIVVQVAVSAVLAMAALLCVQQIGAYSQNSAGFDVDKLALIRLDFSEYADEPLAVETLRQLMEHLRRARQVDAVALSTGLPEGVPGNWFRVEPVTATGSTRYRPVLACSADIFRVLGLTLVAGRGLEEGDRADTAPVVVLTASTVRQLFGEHNAVGRTVSLTKQPSPDGGATVPLVATVVGVVTDATSGSRRASEAVGYVPFLQHYDSRVMIVARTNGDPKELVPLLTESVRLMDARLPIIDAGTGSSLAGPAMQPLQYTASLAGILGGVAFFLTMVGTYGLLSHSVQLRTTEIGIRMALGAPAEQVMKSVVMDGVRPILLGLIVAVLVGGAIGAMSGPVLAVFLPAVDYLAMLAVLGAGVLLAGMAACYFPAKRASRIEPIEAFRLNR